MIMFQLPLPPPLWWRKKREEKRESKSKREQEQESESERVRAREWERAREEVRAREWEWEWEQEWERVRERVQEQEREREWEREREREWERERKFFTYMPGALPCPLRPSFLAFADDWRAYMVASSHSKLSFPVAVLLSFPVNSSLSKLSKAFSRFWAARSCVVEVAYQSPARATQRSPFQRTPW